MFLFPRRRTLQIEVTSHLHVKHHKKITMPRKIKFNLNFNYLYLNLGRLSSSVFEHRHQIIGQCFGIRSRDGRNHQECSSPRELRESKSTSRDFLPIKSLEEYESAARSIIKNDQDDQKFKSFSRSKSLPKNLSSNQG